MKSACLFLVVLGAASATVIPSWCPTIDPTLDCVCGRVKMGPCPTNKCAALTEACSRFVQLHKEQTAPQHAPDNHALRGPARTAAPARAATTTVAPAALKSCTLDGVEVKSGFSVAGSGLNYCNRCKCTNGELSCTRKTCGRGQAGGAGAGGWKTCESVVCFPKAHTDAGGKDHTVIIVKSHHKDHGQHHCAFNKHTGSCTCQCKNVKVAPYNFDKPATTAPPTTAPAAVPTTETPYLSTYNASPLGARNVDGPVNGTPNGALAKFNWLLKKADPRHQA